MWREGVQTPPHPGSHVVGSVQHHAFLGEAVEIGCVENRAGVVYLEIKRGLVVHDDKEEVRSFSTEKPLAQKAGNG